ncbi:MAG: response regulator transcription factor [Chloroflexi bacterium]|nr:response regulator transcription factor [Chloroflexota bacterium]
MMVLVAGAGPGTVVKVEVAIRLRWPGARVVVPSDADSILETIGEDEPDVVLFQPGPGTWSMERFINEVRAFSDVPLVLMESESPNELDEVQALETGADDYFRQSASLINLTARFVALLRRVRRASALAQETVSSGGLLVDPSTYEVHMQGQRVDLTFTEFRVLYFLARNRGAVVTHNALCQEIWGDEVDATNLLKKYIQRIRRKLNDNPQSPRWIASIHGIGYRFLGAGARESEPVAAAV